MRNIRRFAVILLAATSICLVTAAAPTESQAWSFLNANGYPEADYRLLMSWEEVAPEATGTYVYGYWLERIADGAFLDVYSTVPGDPLDDGDLEALGISRKDFDAAPAMAPSESLWRKKAPSPAVVVPKGVEKKVSPGAVIVAPPVDLSAVLEEDRRRELALGKGAKRIGVLLDLPETLRVEGLDVSRGAWVAVPGGGMLWSVLLYSAEAVGQRVHFRDLELPAGAEVVVYNAEDPAEAYGPFTGLYPGDPDLWTPTCFSEAVGIECYVPTGVDVSQVRIAIDEIAHQYVPLWGVLGSGTKTAGSCNLDVTCYPDWDFEALGVGGLGTVGADGLLWCTGTLIADLEPATATPFFLAANHCVYSQGRASTIEVYWLYQTDVCNGTPPAPATVPRTTGGADYLAGSDDNDAGNDFSLLRLRQDPPAGLTYVGWTSARPALGSAVTCIHHPRGDFKRITFGSLTNRPSSDPLVLDKSDNYHQSTWSAGTTEGGSSGSPLFVDDGQLIIGQLWGGLASCLQPDAPDFYGRFDLTYPVVRSWLNPSPPPEDIDGNGTVDALDVQLVIRAALGLDDNPDADVDGSGAVDATDVQRVIRAALGLSNPPIG